jgi:hypothetical protein
MVINGDFAGDQEWLIVAKHVINDGYNWLFLWDYT